MPLVLSTKTGLISPQFLSTFDDDFNTVKKEQHDISIWQQKAHLQDAKTKLNEMATRSSLISQPVQPGKPAHDKPAHDKPSLAPYGDNNPVVLQQLPQLIQAVALSDIAIKDEPNNVFPEAPATALPQPGPPTLAHAPWQGPPSEPATLNQQVYLAPSGLTRTGRPVRWPARFPYGAYNMQPTTVANLHSQASTPLKTSIPLHVFEPLHQPSPSLKGIWIPCNNPIGTCLLRP